MMFLPPIRHSRRAFSTSRDRIASYSSVSWQHANEQCQASRLSKLLQLSHILEAPLARTHLAEVVQRPLAAEVQAGAVGHRARLAMLHATLTRSLHHRCDVTVLASNSLLRRFHDYHWMDTNSESRDSEYFFLH